MSRDRSKTKAALIEELNREREKTARLMRLLAPPPLDPGPGPDQGEAGPDNLGRHSQMVFDSISDAVSIIGARDFRIIDANRAFLEQYGLSRGDVLGATCHEITHHRAQPCVPPLDPCPLFQTVHEGAPATVEHCHFERGGEKVFVEITTFPMFDREGRVQSVVHISRDITERKKAEEERQRLIGELELAQAELKQLFDEVPCFISVQDRELNLTAVNRLFEEHFGLAQGCRCFQSYKQRNEPCLSCPVQETFEDGLSHCSEEIVTTKSGEQLHVLVRTAPIRDAKGEITRVMEMSTDITEIRALQDRLSSLGLMIGSMSHGVKGLLTGLDGGMYQLDTGHKKGDQARIREGLEVVKLMVKRIRTMVLDILYYAKERDLDWELADAREFCQELASIIEPKARTQGVGLVRRFEEGAGDLEMDVGVVRSAMLNILENALDACLENPSQPEPRIIFGLGRRGDELLFEIADNGTGIDAETRNNMFTLFFSSKGSKGTGLGLFIAHEIITQHGGRIEVDSEPGQGTRFRITLPRRLPEPIKASSAGRMEVRSLKTCRQAG